VVVELSVAVRATGTPLGREQLRRSMTVEIGVILPTSTPDRAHPILADVRDAAQLAEQLGLDSIWSTDHLTASAPILESTAVLATAAAVTERISIGYGVMLLALRPVAWAAKQISSLQHLFGGRLLLGIGTGNPAHGDIGWRAAGASYPERGSLSARALTGSVSISSTATSNSATSPRCCASPSGRAYPC
jgi:hypothetical protein